MATIGSEDTNCPMCLDTYTNPKFLPCHHTFCEGCIDNLAQKHKKRKFPCPSCRKVTVLPPRGAADLQSNFYIKAPPARPIPRGGNNEAPPSPSFAPRATSPAGNVDPDLCPSHPDKQIDFYCSKCDAAICLYCKLTSHEQHRTFDIASAVEFKKKKTLDNRRRLREAMLQVEAIGDSMIEQREALERQRAKVEKDISERRNAVVEAAKKHAENQVKTLQSAYNGLDKGIVDNIEQCNINLSKLSNFLEEVDAAIRSSDAQKVMVVAREMTGGRGSRSALEEMMNLDEKSYRMPTFQSKTSTNVMMQTTRDYVGNVQLSVYTKK